ncbi:MAG TPA: single-stranded-DNA-specific exonuclease RecJ [Candidatus Acutalibacter stercoravium]|nr:single-stranded-DNA-specific exonuclease RecJ [Candidatus Acutalibacter stercoravium]
MNLKKWEVAPLNRERAAQIAERYSLPFFLSMMLEIRGFSSEEQIRGLLSGGQLSDPFLMKDMDKAAARIRRAMENFEKIAVYGDYDADGVTATAILFTYLEAVGADVIYYIPQREGEGYGMNLQAVEKLHGLGVGLIVTVDNGIASVKEVERARELGMDVVVTDHHRPQERLPQAAAVVDAHQPGDSSPFKELCGAGVALKLVMALEGGDPQDILEEYADLAALGTVADVVPVLGENRQIVKAGLSLLARGGRAGVDALMEESGMGGKKATATSLAFTVIPRINATGRMGSPDRAVRLLTCDDPEEAQPLSQEICEDNDRRRQVEGEIAQQAIEAIQRDPQLLYSRVIVVEGKGWHHGVIGIVASRVTERFGKPSIVISVDGEEARGSGRSVEGFSLFQAVSACSDLLERFGGHPMAAGVTLKPEDVALFRQRINQYAAEACPEMPAQVLRLDCRLNPGALSPEMPQSLEPLEPFGSGNPQPLFGLYSMELREIVPVGGGNHLRLVCAKKGAMLTCMCFGVKPEEFPFVPGETLDLAVTLEAREFRGEAQLTVSVREAKLSGLDMDQCIHTYRVYEKLQRGEALSREEGEELLPTRQDLAALYRKLASLKGAAFGLQSLLGALPGFNLGKLLLCLEMLQERRLIALLGGEQRKTAELLPTQGKVDIFASPVYGRAKQLAEN